MSDDNKQDLKEKEVTLNLTEKELEEYKTYLKFKNKFEEQEESQDTTEETSENVEEVTTTSMFDYENAVFTEEELEQIKYKKYFKKPLGDELLNSYSTHPMLTLILFCYFTWLFYYSSRNWHGGIWIIIKISMALVAIWAIRMFIENVLDERNNKRVIPKIINYNNQINNANWVEILDYDEFNEYYDIAKDVIDNKLKLKYKNPQFISDEYTEVYKIDDSNLVVIFGIYHFELNDVQRYLSFTMILENDEYFLNIVASQILREKF